MDNYGSQYILTLWRHVSIYRVGLMGSGSGCGEDFMNHSAYLIMYSGGSTHEREEGHRTLTMNGLTETMYHGGTYDNQSALPLLLIGQDQYDYKTRMAIVYVQVWLLSNMIDYIFLRMIISIIRAQIITHGQLYEWKKRPDNSAIIYIS